MCVCAAEIVISRTTKISRRTLLGRFCISTPPSDKPNLRHGSRGGQGESVMILFSAAHSRESVSLSNSATCSFPGKIQKNYTRPKSWIFPQLPAAGDAVDAAFEKSDAQPTPIVGWISSRSSGEIQHSEPIPIVGGISRRSSGKIQQSEPIHPAREYPALRANPPRSRVEFPVAPPGESTTGSQSTPIANFSIARGRRRRADAAREHRGGQRGGGGGTRVPLRWRVLHLRAARRPSGEARAVAVSRTTV